VSDIDRGAWIPDNDRPNCETFRCPFCGETVFMRRGHATYPTCPWCISDMPDADDLDTPEEIEQMKKGNRAATNKAYCDDPAMQEKKKEASRRYYQEHKEEFREKNRIYRETHREKCRELHRRWFEENRDHANEKARENYAKHREERCAAYREKYESDPAFRAKKKEYRERTYGKKMREVISHIRGVPEETLPRYEFTPHMPRKGG